MEGNGLVTSEKQKLQLLELIFLSFLSTKPFGSAKFTKLIINVWRSFKNRKSKQKRKTAVGNSVAKCLRTI